MRGVAMGVGGLLAVMLSGCASEPAAQTERGVRAGRRRGRAGASAGRDVAGTVPAAGRQTLYGAGGDQRPLPQLIVRQALHPVA